MNIHLQTQVPSKDRVIEYDTYVDSDIALSSSCMNRITSLRVYDQDDLTFEYNRIVLCTALFPILGYNSIMKRR